ncbi:MAG TPA: hypothetical protein VIF63_06430 [Candidatus Limnocylindrales bacterium]|jgi:hypothetical protein
MSDQLFDRAVRDWLEDGSDRTPPASIDAVLLAVKTTPQERDLRIPRRFSPMTTSMRVAAGIALAAIVGGGALLYLNRGPAQGVGGEPTPSPTTLPTPTPFVFTKPSVAPSATPPSTASWIPFTSTQYGYQIAYPPTWEADVTASRDWVLAADRLLSPSDGMNGSADHLIGDGVGGVTAVTGFAADVPTGQSESQWLAAYYADAAFCPTSVPIFQPITVDGHQGRLDQCYDAQAIVFIGDRVYVFAIHRTDNQPLFSSFLSTVRFP